MGVYIKGMQMPSFEHQSWDIRNGTDSKWYVVDTNAETSDSEWHEIIPVPDHGDLIDRDMLKENEQWWDNDYAEDGYDHIVTIRDVENVPTIIPADREGEA